MLTSYYVFQRKKPPSWHRQGAKCNSLSYIQGWHQSIGPEFSKPYIHNSAVTIIAPTLEETELFDNEIIEKLNRTTGVTVLIIPLRGWSAYDQAAKQATVERGWAEEKGDGLVWFADPDNPKWSKRATLMWKIFKEKINKSNDNLDLIVCNNHILDIELTDFLNQIMGEMLNGKCSNGSYRDMENVV